MFGQNCYLLGVVCCVFYDLDSRAPRPTNEISGAQGKLIRMVEDQLAQGDFALDVEQLRNQFTLADRLHRDSLSHGEVFVCLAYTLC